MDEIDLKLLTIINKDITLIKEPFKPVALQIGISQKEVVTRLCQLKKEGIIRKFGASIKPNSIGFSANALVAWKVPQNRILEVGDYLAKLPEISHCYERKTVDGKWEFNLYTVMHAQERESINRKVSQISAETEITEYKILFSTRDLKKSINANPSKIQQEATEVLESTSKERDHF
jgi:DNA-binding Lrp family transcriptional regulator